MQKGYNSSRNNFDRRPALSMRQAKASTESSSTARSRVRDSDTRTIVDQIAGFPFERALVVPSLSAVINRADGRQQTE